MFGFSLIKNSFWHFLSSGMWLNLCFVFCWKQVINDLCMQLINSALLTRGVICFLAWDNCTQIIAERRTVSFEPPSKGMLRQQPLQAWKTSTTFKKHWGEKDTLCHAFQTKLPQQKGTHRVLALFLKTLWKVVTCHEWNTIVYFCLIGLKRSMCFLLDRRDEGWDVWCLPVPLCRLLHQTEGKASDHE